MSLKIRTGDANFGPKHPILLIYYFEFYFTVYKKTAEGFRRLLNPIQPFSFTPINKKNSISKGTHTPLNQKFLLVGFTIKYFKNIKIYITRTSG